MFVDPGPIGNFYRRITKKKGHNVAIVAVARKYVTYAWHMIKNNEPYRYAQPKPTGVKLAKLRVRATGKRLKLGSKKGQPRSKNYGTGKHIRILHSIADVCEREGLPLPVPFDELAAGEQKYVRKNKMVGVMRKSHTRSKMPERGTQKK